MNKRFVASILVLLLVGFVVVYPPEYRPVDVKADGAVAGWGHDWQWCGWGLMILHTDFGDYTGVYVFPPSEHAHFRIGWLGEKKKVVYTLPR